MYSQLNFLQLQLPLLHTSCNQSHRLLSFPSSSCSNTKAPFQNHRICWERSGSRVVLASSSSSAEETELQNQEEEEEEVEPSEEDLEYVKQIKRVLELLKKNRDMLFSEVKLTVMIEDPREVERRRLLGIEYSDSPTRDDLAAVLEEVNEGRVPKDRVALKMLAEEMMQWPNLEVEVTKKKPGKSMYAKATDTGVNPQEAARRLKIDWDSAAEIDESEGVNETDVPALVGFGALYLVSAFPIIIGVSVVLILFYNSLQ